MNRIDSLLFVILSFCFTFISAYADSLPECVVCGKKIQAGAQYLISENKVFCSQACFAKWSEAKLPKCAVCGKPVQSGFQANGKAYCSQECLASIFPTCYLCGQKSGSGAICGYNGHFFCAKCAEKDKCFICGEPASGEALSDGRDICKACNKSSIKDFKEAVTLFNAVRLTMSKRLGLATEHNIKIVIVDWPGLASLVPAGISSPDAIEMGLYRYEETVETITEKKRDWKGKETSRVVDKKVTDKSDTIFILSRLSREKFIEVAAHELAHDWMQYNYPQINSALVKEGFSEYIASCMNKIYGNEDLNKRMESSPDPIYGEGFRMIRRIAGTEGINAVLRAMKNGELR